MLFFRAPDGGSNISVVAGAGVVSIVNNQNGNVLALRSLASVERLVLVGSNVSSDVFNMFLGTGNSGIEDGVLAYGRGGTGDRLNTFGRPLLNDTFNVADSSFSTGSVSGLRRGGGNPADNAIILAVVGRDVDVNGNKIFSTGFETIRLVTLGGTDTIIDPDALAVILSIWNPLSPD